MELIKGRIPQTGKVDDAKPQETEGHIKFKRKDQFYFGMRSTDPPLICMERTSSRKTNLNDCCC